MSILDQDNWYIEDLSVNLHGCILNKSDILKCSLNDSNFLSGKHACDPQQSHAMGCDHKNVNLKEMGYHSLLLESTERKKPIMAIYPCYQYVNVLSIYKQDQLFSEHMNFDAINIPPRDFNKNKLEGQRWCLTYHNQPNEDTEYYDYGDGIYDWVAPGTKFTLCHYKDDIPTAFNFCQMNDGKQNENILPGRENYWALMSVQIWVKN